MRVLYVSHFAGLGGAERSLLELMIAVRELGVEPKLLSPAGALSDAATSVNISVDTWDARPIKRPANAAGLIFSIPHLLNGWARLKNTVASFKPQIIHANSTQAMLWIGPVGRWRRCPVLWHWRDFYEHRLLAKMMAQWADAIVAISSSTFLFAADLLGASSEKLVLIRNGIRDLPPRATDNSNILRHCLDLPLNGPLVVMAGHCIPRKGHAILIKALADLMKTRSDVSALLLCAEYDESDAYYALELRRQVAELGCTQRIRITGGTENIAPVLYAADLVAVPSLREPFGRIAVEAMLARKPVIASDVDGLSEILGDAETGLLVPPRDPAGFARGILSILEGRDFWRAKGEAARLRALKLFSVSRAAVEMVDLYRKVCAGQLETSQNRQA